MDTSLSGHESSALATAGATIGIPTEMTSTHNDRAVHLSLLTCSPPALQAPFGSLLKDSPSDCRNQVPRLPYGGESPHLERPALDVAGEVVRHHRGDSQRSVLDDADPSIALTSVVFSTAVASSSSPG